MNPKVHFVTFHTEGPPLDHGPDLRSATRSFETAARNVFDSFVAHTPRSLLSSSASWKERLHNFEVDIESHPDYFPELKWNRSWARMGLISWKPRMILDRLLNDDVSEGDLVYYHDSNAEKYPDYLHGIDKSRAWLIRSMKDSDLLLFRDNRAKLISDTKPELWKKFFELEEAKHLHHIWAGALAVRKSPEGIHFISHWDSMVTDIENILPISTGSTSEGFEIHSPDQAILGCLWHSRNSLHPDLPARCVYLMDTRQIPPPRRPVLGPRKWIQKLLGSRKKT